MSMFHNPFNSKVVSDITRFLEEHKDDITIHPCLDEAARQTAEQIGDEPILEDRRRAMRERFNDAVTDCGCRGTTKESNDFAKSVERYIEEKRKLPPEFLKNIQKKKDAAKKGEDAKKEEVEEESWEDENPSDSIIEAKMKLDPEEAKTYIIDPIVDELMSGRKQGLKKIKQFLKDNQVGEAVALVKPLVMVKAIAYERKKVGKAWYDMFITDQMMLDCAKKVVVAIKGKLKSQVASKPVKESFDSLTEAAKKRKPYEEVYYKWFDRVSVDIMDMTKIAKEIQAALDSKADLEKVMPELVKKYRKG